ncbi:CDP-diacylglycerol--glycerol-3-phosphate 3-phosphatidyltransferase, mitochondrial-like isoform X2 [Amphibalanus amphitrite]|uniref:CDP-diacylglycerol--glycerol-3-phosphate 3-phosphatidyltransferase, mitochondrial-like isoform X2 n=1 Tax=Amphibalanus amphitrite TaxID=1232801 RepID=UPI001C920B53|nr:CDP-diacylglycerol--glycerol-3-phosphate 3-phosphatidyltransferase, mitochondrial-like isoform X2 [Amphibalanus amphitrite]
MHLIQHFSSVLNKQISFLVLTLILVSGAQSELIMGEKEAGELVEELKKECPVFQLNGSQVEVLTDPADFYQFLVEGCHRAKRRIIFSSLYLGNGPKSLELLSALSESLERCPDLEVRVLLDCLRGSRGHTGSPSSRHLLAPLVRDHGERCQVSLYHTPTLRSFIKWLLPDRWNEVIGLQHMKVYIFDDDLVISGANLNDDYFTQRQDRYMVFRGAAHLAEFYTQLVAAVSRFSLQLTADDQLKLSPSWSVHPYQGDLSKFCELARAELEAVLAGWRRSPPPPPAAADTWVLPTVNLAPVGIDLDERVTRRLLRADLLKGDVHLATGYFNLTDANMAELSAGQPRPVSVLCAHPEANGFLRAGDVSGYIPAAYTYLLHRFHAALPTDSSVTLHEYRRPGWTFHSYRSSYRDLESQVVVVTKNAALRHALADERRKLYCHSQPVDGSTFARPDRFVPRWVRLVSRLIRHFF